MKRNPIIQSWSKEIVAGATYRINITGSQPHSPDMDAILEWMPSANDSRDQQGKNAMLKRVFLDESKKGWSGVHTAPSTAAGLKVKIFNWKQAGSGPVKTDFHFTCERVKELPQRLVKMAVAYQRLPRSPTLEGNRQVMIDTIQEAGRQKVDLLCMSETFLDRRLGSRLGERAVTLDGPEMAPIRQAVQAAGLYAVFSVHEKSESRVYNTAVLFSPKGDIIGTYRNRCPALVEKEAGVVPGDSFPVFDTPLGKIGMLICWDVTFPETALALSRQGAEIICVPIAGAGFKPYWEHTWKARAIDNQVFWLASTDTCDCGGTAPSQIISPDGRVLAETREPNGLAIATVDVSARGEAVWFGVGPCSAEVRNVIEHSRPK